MEEDIKILEEIDITDFYNNYSVYTFPEEEIKRKCQAIENLLTRYKQLEEENKRLKKYEDLEWQEFNELAVASLELEKKDKVINEMAEWLYEDDTSFGYGNLEEVNTQEKIKEYFTNKVEREGK